MIDHAKPYPAYKDSGHPWLGDVPEHWEVRGLGATTNRRSGQNDGGDLPLLSVLREKGVVLRSSLSREQNHNFVPDDLSNYRLTREGDLVINKMKAWQGSVGVAPCDGVVSPAYYVFQLLGIEKTFAHRLFRSPFYKHAFAQASDGVRIGQWDLSINRMKRIPVPVPPPAEQAGIVKVLGAVDRRVNRLVRAKRRLLGLLAEQKQAVITHAVTRGLDPHAPTQPSGVPWLGDVPEHWEVVPLKRVATVQTGLTLGKDYEGQDVRRYPYLRVANVQAGHLSLKHVKDIAVPEQVAANCLLREGDVLMTEGGDIDKLGRGCIWKNEVDGCLHQNHIFAVRCNSLLRPAFLSSILASAHGRSYFELTAKKTTNLASTNSTTLREFPVFLPSGSEQDQILGDLAERLKATDAAADLARREIDLIREYRTRLVADVVTGKLDVRAVAEQLADDVDDPAVPADVAADLGDEADEADDADGEADAPDDETGED